MPPRDPTAPRSRRGWPATRSFYFAKLARSRQDAPGDDILGLLIQMTKSPVALTDRELLYNAYSFLIGGDETTRLSMIGAVHALTQWPDEWNRLRAGEVSVESAVEEFLRWTTPTLHAGRVATRDTTLDGRHIARDDIVTVWNSSANFDPRQFDDPTRLRLSRAPNRHLAFAIGPHFCLRPAGEDRAERTGHRTGGDRRRHRADRAAEAALLQFSERLQQPAGAVRGGRGPAAGHAG
ncbi:cytochrome P450 [Micromonospora sp. M12]